MHGAEGVTPERPRHDPRAASLLLIGAGIVLAGLTVHAALGALAEQTAFSEYLGQARRCVELGDCPSRGGKTGGLPLFHGASWIRLLAQSLRAGHDLTWVQSVVLVTWVLAIPVFVASLWHHLGRCAAVLGLALFFPVVLVGTDITSLTYTNLLPLPWTAYFAATALFVETRRLVWPVVGSVALAAAVSAELGSIVMVPFHGLLVLLVAPRRVWGLLVCGIAFATAFCLDSMDAAREIVRQLPTLRFAVGLAISGGVAFALARLLPQRLFTAATPARERVRGVMIAALLYATGGIWLAGILLMHAWPNPRYFLPASIPFLYLLAEEMRGLGDRALLAVWALAAAALLLLAAAPHAQLILQVPVMLIVTAYAAARARRLLRRAAPVESPRVARWPAVAICAAAIVTAVPDLVVLRLRAPTQTLALPEAEGVVAALYGAGYSYGQILGALQGPAADDLMPLLAERDPTLFRDAAPPLRAEDFSLLVATVPETDLTRTQGVIGSVAAGAGRVVVVVRGERAFLDWRRMRRCAGSGEVACATPRLDAPLPRNWPYVELASAAAAPAPPHDGPVRYEVPVHTPGRGEAHLVRLGNEWPNRWRITAVRGVEYEGAVPGPEIRLPDTRPADGVIELEFTPRLPGDMPWFWLPHVAEVGAANAHLIAALR